MADEPTQAPVEEQDTPTPEATQETPSEAPESPETDTQDTDWQQRYTDLQPEYTRATQEAAQLRQIIELAQQGDPEALNFLGYETAEEDTEDDDELSTDPDERLDRIEQMIQSQQEQSQAAQAQEAFLVDVNDGIEKIEEKEGRTLSDEETQFVLAQAEAQLRGGGKLDVEAAFQPLETLSKTAVDRYVNSKKQAQSAPLGSAGDQKINFLDDEARQARMAEVMEADAASQED